MVAYDRSTLDSWVAQYGLSASAGLTPAGSWMNRASLFAAAGIDWPDGARPEDFHARQTDYPFSVDLGGGTISAAVDRRGCVRRVVMSSGSKDVRGKTITGVYTYKSLSFLEGRIGWKIRAEGVDLVPAEVGVDFIGHVLPVFTSRTAKFDLRWSLIVASGPDSPHAIFVVGEVANRGSEDAEVSLHPDLALSTGASSDIEISTHWHNPDDGSVTLKGGGVGRFAVSMSFGPKQGGQPSDYDAIVDVVEREFTARLHGVGTLRIPDDPWFEGQIPRLLELARQSALFSTGGDSVGSFWGSNANPIPDVWFRDFCYTLLALVEFAPTRAAQHLRYLAAYARPETAWGREVALYEEPSGLEHSIGNAVLPAVLAKFLIRRHGAEALEPALDRFDAYARGLLEQLLTAFDRDSPLYRTLYISDGPSRGMNHIGSNILVWTALRAFADELSPFAGGHHQEVVEVADLLREAIETQGTSMLPGGLEAFVEGIYTDGRPVWAHDGEESDLTLASYYGLVARDDSRVINHAQWARSAANPYYSTRTRGVDFWDWDEYNGITYPGHAHALAGTNSVESLDDALKLIRRTTDADGSLWWWPHRHNEQLAERVKRGLGKCGWSAGVIVAKLMHDVYGIRRNWPDKELEVAPFVPWSAFSWTDLSYGSGLIDVEFGNDKNRQAWLKVSNRTDECIEITVEVPLPHGSFIEDIRLDGGNGRYTSEVVGSFGATAVRHRKATTPGSSVLLEVAWRVQG